MTSSHSSSTDLISEAKGILESPRHTKAIQPKRHLKSWYLPLIAFGIPSALGLSNLLPISYVLIFAGILYLLLCSRLENPDIASPTHIFGNLSKHILPILLLFGSCSYLLLNIGSKKWTINWLGMKNMTLQINDLVFPNGIFTVIFMFALCAGLIYASLKSAKPLEIGSALIYGGAAIGITLGSNLVITFAFWEVMAIGSTLVLWASNTIGARAASFRYLFMHVFGGVLFFIGICIMQFKHDSLLLEPMALKHVGNYLVLLGVLVNVAAPPFWAWVADSYPKASPSGAIFLSAFTTKTAIFVLLILFKGQAFLAPIGLLMVVYGIIYALNCRDMRQILAYCIVSQCGYMVIGIGVGTTTALIAVSIQAVAHILYKGLLMMTAGSVLYDNPEPDIHALGNRAEILPYTALFALIGGFALSALPLTLTFASKNMLTEALGYSPITSQEISTMLALASGAAPLYIGLRWPWLIFFKDSSISAWLSALKKRTCLIQELPNIIGYLLFTIPLVALTPYLLQQMHLIPPTDFSYELAMVIHQLQLILSSVLIFIIVKRWITPQHFGLYDFDIFYRTIGFNSLKIGLHIIRAMSERIYRLQAAIYKNLAPARKKTKFYVRRLGGMWPTSAMTMFACLMLTCTLTFLYFK